jgi:hypothetical protein
MAIKKKAVQEEVSKPTPLVPLQEAPPIVHEAQNLVLYDLAIVIGAAYQMIIEPTQSGNVPKRLANKIFPLLHSSRPEYYNDSDLYLDMLFHSALQLGLLKLVIVPGAQKQRYVPGVSLEKWTVMTQEDQARLLLAFWSDHQNQSWIDVAGVDYQPDNYYYYMNRLAARRSLLEYIIQVCQPGVWYDMQVFLQAIKDYNPLLLRTSSPYSSYGNNAQVRKAMMANWDSNDGEIIAGMLDSTLHEFGLVTTGWRSPTLSITDRTNEGNPDAFQLTELAGKAFAPKEKGASESGDTTAYTRNLIVQPNFELLLLQPDYTTLYRLLPFARVEQIEMVSRLVLTQESVRRGVEAGWSVERVLQTLQEHSQKELPQNVLYTLQDWGRLYKNATVSQILLLEVGNETVADELCASSKLRALELRRLGPCTIAVGGQISMQVLRSTLEKEGVIMHVQGNILTAHNS